MFAPAVAVAGAVFVTARSAAIEFVDAVALLFAGFGSVVVAEIVAVFVIVPVAATPVWTTRVSVEEAPTASVARVQETVPEAPTAGVVQV
jgi:hypothetical protein